MAIMIGTQRSGMTIAFHLPAGTGMIRSTRCLVVIRDREGSEKLAADGYGPA